MSLLRCWQILKKYRLSFLLGVKTTLIVSLSGTFFGFLIGLLVGGLRAMKNEKNMPVTKRACKKLFDILAGIYIEVFRGTPMMVQAVFIYYLIYTTLVRWDKMTAAVVIISINTGAYMAEIIRGGIQSVDKGQYEACRAVGLNQWQSMQHVILPQAIQNCFPAIGNELIVNIKDSSVLMIISITELMFQSSSVAGSTFRFTETYFITAAIYLLLTILCSLFLHALEKRLSHTRTSLPQSDTTFETMRLAKGEKE